MTNQEQNLCVYVRNTFLDVKDENEEAQKARHMKRSWSDPSLASTSASDKEYDSLQGAGRNTPPLVFNTVAPGRDQLRFPNAPSQLQLPSPRSQSGGDSTQYLSDSSLERDRILADDPADQEEQNLCVYVRNTFLDVKDENEEAQKARHMKRSWSDPSLASTSASDKEYDSLQGAGRNTPPLVFNTVAPGRDQLRFPNAASQLQLPSPRSQSGGDSTQYLSDSSLERDRILADDPADQDAVPGPNRSTWSAGAAGHEEGNCKPCAWNWKTMGCSHAASCQFCHMCPKETLKANRKTVMMKLKKLKKEAAAVAAANAPPGPAALQPGLIQGTGTSALLELSAGSVPKADKHNGTVPQ